MSKWARRTVVPLAVIVTAALVLYECGHRVRGVGSASYLVTFESKNPSPIRFVEFSILNETTKARIEEDLREFPAIARSESRMAELDSASDRTWRIWQLTTSTESPFRLAADDYTYRNCVLLIVEFDNGEHWAKFEQLPDPRGQTAPVSIACRIDEGHRLQSPP